jgi:putative chitobiose transport system permease protein
MNARVSRSIGTVSTFLAAWIIAILFMLPVIWVVINSLRPSPSIVDFRELTLPSELTLDNYAYLFASPFTRAFANSIGVTLASTVIGLTVCVLAAYALSAFRFRGREVVFAVIVVSFAIPTDATAFAMLRNFRDWGLNDSYVGLILPGIADGIVILLLRQFFLGIPRELVDAARVDGASWLTVLTRIYIPLSRPVLVGGAILLFITQWQAYLWPLIIVNDPSLQLAPVALVLASRGQFLTAYGTLFAGAVVLSVVPAIILLGLQRYFVRSVARTGITG